MYHQYNEFISIEGKFIKLNNNNCELIIIVVNLMINDTSVSSFFFSAACQKLQLVIYKQFSIYLCISKSQ